MTENLTLENVKEEDYEFLFNLLKNRKSNVSISHRKMPTYSEHIEFIESKPYHQWYIVFFDEERIGSAYLSKNDEDQRSIVKKICKILADENVAFDINGYAKAPPSFRVWAGAAVEPKNIQLLLPWIEWAYDNVKKTYA